MSKARIDSQIGCTINTTDWEEYRSRRGMVMCVLPLPKGEMIYSQQQLPHIEKIKIAINNCMNLDIVIPAEWVEEYNKYVKK